MDVWRLKQVEMLEFRRGVQIVFQDPFSSLNPWMRVTEIVGEPLIVQRGMKGKELRREVGRLLEVVGLRSQYADRFPHEFSGGQRQRLGIARALAPRPQLVVADEPVSALDVSVQAQILNLLIDLQVEFGLSYLFIAHDLSVVRYVSDRVAVMYLGKIVETGEAEEVFRHPRHPYTEALLSALPETDPAAQEARIVLRGDVPSPANPPSGCPFHPRCVYAEDRCKTDPPELVDVSPNHATACLRAQELDLQGKAGLQELVWKDGHPDAPIGKRSRPQRRRVADVAGGSLTAPARRRAHRREKVQESCSQVLTGILTPQAGRYRPFCTLLDPETPQRPAGRSAPR